jgi:M6 family metalloprotease-like protein
MEVSMLASGDEAQQGEAPKKQAFFDAAVRASDAETDYSNVDIVLFAVPRAKSIFKNGPHIFNFIWNAYLKTSEGNIYNAASAGDWFLKSGVTEPPWVYYVHEIGHMIGIPHQSNEDLKGENRIWIQNPMNGYDIMSNQGGAVRTMSTWLRWLAGWLSDDQVICVEKNQITDQYYELSPINNLNSGVESLIVKLSDTEAIVIESRRFDERFDRTTGNSKNGIIVYTVDSTKASAQANQALVSPRDITRYIYEPNWRSQSELDAFFFQGDSAIVSGIKIEAVRIGSSKDVVRVTKVN